MGPSTIYGSVLMVVSIIGPIGFMAISIDSRVILTGTSFSTSGLRSVTTSGSTFALTASS